MSLQLLEDLNHMFSSNTSTTTRHGGRGIWKNYDHTISKLKAFLPPVLSESDLIELDPQQSSLHTLPSLIYEELCLHNQCLVSLRASLELLSSCLKSRVPLSITVGQTILSIGGDVVPDVWMDSLPKPLYAMTSLKSALSLLKARLAFYNRTLHSGTLPSNLNPLLFSNPQGIIFSRALSYAAECHLCMSGVIINGKVSALLLISMTSPPF